MSVRTLEQMEKNSEGGSNYFSLKDGESVKVRFLYNTVEDELPFAVHEYAANGKYATIDCSREEGAPLSDCKHCANGNKAKYVVYVPLYNMADNQIYYWKRTAFFMTKTLNPILKASTAPGNVVSGTTYIINRSGSTMQDTRYNIIPDASVPYDGKQRTEFGEILNPLQGGMISPNETEFNEVPANNQANANNFQETRRTTNIF